MNNKDKSEINNVVNDITNNNVNIAEAVADSSSASIASAAADAYAESHPVENSKSTEATPSGNGIERDLHKIKSLRTVIAIFLTNVQSNLRSLVHSWHRSSAAANSSAYMPATSVKLHGPQASAGIPRL